MFMRAFTSQIDLKRFIKDFSSLYRGASDELKNELTCKIEAGRNSIVTFLRSVDSIEDAKIRKCSRMAAIAQMYNAVLDYRGGHPYVEASGDVVFLQFKSSTVIVSKYGEILFGEKELRTHAGLNYGHGFVAQKVENDNLSDKYGFISLSGSLVLPFIFSGFDNHIMECSPIFEGTMFDFSLYGNVDSVESETLKWIIEDAEDRDMCCCITKDSLLFTLKAKQDYSRDYDRDVLLELRERMYEHTQKVKLLLSDIVVTKEQLQELLESR